MNRLIAVLKICVYIPSYFKNWITAYLDIFKILQLLNVTEVLYVLKDDTNIFARPRQYDIGIISEVFLWQVYAPKISGFSIKKNDIILDAGGYIGDFAIFAAKKASKGHIYSFEPVAENFFMIKKNIEINNIKNITAIQNAITGTSELLRFNIYKNAYGSSSIYSSPHQEIVQINLKTLGINDFIKKYKLNQIDVIKLDCEGAEYDIIYQCNQEILKKSRNIIIEFHKRKGKKNNPQSVITYLKNLNFQHFGVVDNNAEISMLYFKQINEKP